MNPPPDSWRLPCPRTMLAAVFNETTSVARSCSRCVAGGAEERSA